jgi:hypothetical protein
MVDWRVRKMVCQLLVSSSSRSGGRPIEGKGETGVLQGQLQCMLNMKDQIRLKEVKKVTTLMLGASQMGFMWSGVERLEKLGKV